MEIVTWRSGGFVVDIVPALGSSVAALAWRDGRGGMHDLLQRASDEAIAGRRHSGFGMFLMAPFTNRIDRGRFVFDGREMKVPVNRPDQQVAIHGLLRDAVWQVAEASPARLRLVHRAAADATYRTHATLDITAGDQAVTFSLTIVNGGDRRLPFGLGFHPWFVAEAETTAWFDGAAWIRCDERGLPAAVEPIDGIPGRIEPLRPHESPCDVHVAGWTGRARILRPRAGFAIEVAGSPAFTNLQVHVPKSRETLCLEPVSHVIDVVNRQAFAAWGDMTPLPPGGSITGEMTLSVTPVGELT